METRAQPARPLGLVPGIRPRPWPRPRPIDPTPHLVTNTSTSWALFSSPAALRGAAPSASHTPTMLIGQIFHPAQELELMASDWSTVVHTHGTAPPPALGAGAGSGTLRHRAGRGLAPSLPVRSLPRFLGHLLTVPCEVLSSRLSSSAEREERPCVPGLRQEPR